MLSEILKNSSNLLGFNLPPELLVGIETADAATVYLLNDEQALIATTGFFMPIVDDPYDFDRIAATNAISDVYAMGGTPIMAFGPGRHADQCAAAGDHRRDLARWPGRARAGKHHRLWSGQATPWSWREDWTKCLLPPFKLSSVGIHQARRTRRMAYLC